MSGRHGDFLRWRFALPDGPSTCFDKAAESFGWPSPHGKWVAYGFDDNSSGARVAKTKLWPLNEGQPKIVKVRGRAIGGWTSDSQAPLFLGGAPPGDIWGSRSTEDRHGPSRISSCKVCTGSR
jgi:hypothetical protein